MIEKVSVPPHICGSVLRQVDCKVDARGLSCPMPLLQAKQALNKLESGQSLWVLATDVGSVRDFQAFTQLSGHHLDYFAEYQQEYHYILVKKSESSL